MKKFTPVDCPGHKPDPSKDACIRCGLGGAQLAACTHRHRRADGRCTDCGQNEPRRSWRAAALAASPLIYDGRRRLKYPGYKLRQLNAEKGVGSSRKVTGRVVHLKGFADEAYKA